MARQWPLPSIALVSQIAFTHYGPTPSIELDEMSKSNSQWRVQPRIVASSIFSLSLHPTHARGSGRSPEILLFHCCKNRCSQESHSAGHWAVLKIAFTTGARGGWEHVFPEPPVLW